MKSKITEKIALALVFAVALASHALVLSGCAATPTKESSGEFIDDSAITTKVKAALVKDDTTKSREITVETFKGVVQLSGFVDSSVEMARAGELAGAVAGVKEVKNNLVVK